MDFFLTKRIEPYKDSREEEEENDNGKGKKCYHFYDLPIMCTISMLCISIIES